MLFFLCQIHLYPWQEKLHSVFTKIQFATLKKNISLEVA